MYGRLSCSSCRRRTCGSCCAARGGVRIPGSLPRPIRRHTESDLRVFLRWCTDQHLEATAEAILAEKLATADEISTALSSLHAYTRQPDTLLAEPRVLEVWARGPARRPGAAAGGGT
jgi:hypothetical protein